MHTRPFGQDTPPSPTLLAPSGCGTACCPQAFTRPNQRSIRGEREVPASPSAVRLTDGGARAFHRTRDVHQGVALRPSRVRGGLDVPASAVPAFGKRASVRARTPAACPRYRRRCRPGPRSRKRLQASPSGRPGSAQSTSWSRPSARSCRAKFRPYFRRRSRSSATGRRCRVSDPYWLGVGMICQLVPSQCSIMGASGRGFPDPVSTKPTAKHEFADEQSTPNRLFAGPPMTGVGVTVQAAEATEGASSSATVATRQRKSRGSRCLTAEIRASTSRPA